jgi:hypothetical protein
MISADSADSTLIPGAMIAPWSPGWKATAVTEESAGTVIGFEMIGSRA